MDALLYIDGFLKKSKTNPKKTFSFLMNIFAHFSLKFDRYSNFVQIYKHFMLWYVVTNEKT